MLPPRSPALEALLAQRDLILITGKGGTGKSTLVAALGELAAQRRGSALLVELSAHPRLPEMIDPHGSVRTICLEAEEVVVSVLSRLLGLPTVVTRLMRNRIIQLFIRTSPAVREMILLDELRHLVETHSRQRCPVLVDLPATGHAVSFLDTPRAVHRLLRVGPVAAAARQAEALLLDGSRCELAVVSLPEELPVNETIDLVRQCTDLGVASRMVFVNQVPPPVIEARDRALLEAMQHQGSQALELFATMAQSELDDLETARAQIERLRTAVETEILELPRLAAGDPRACVLSMLRTLAP